MRLKDLTLKEFLSRTAANEAVPGGGSSAALNAAMASALGEMMANLTIGKKRYNDVEERMKSLAAVMEAYRNRFVGEIDRDADAYRQVMVAYKLPKESEVEKRERAEKIEAALKAAAQVPMEVAEAAFEMLPLLAEGIEKGNSNAATDGVVGAMICRTAIMAALLNVRVNLSGIRDQRFAGQLTERCNRIEKETILLEAALINRVKATY